MNILNKISQKNLLLNKKRSIGTLIGIILSTALICATAGLLTSLQHTLIHVALEDRGNYHIALYQCSSQQIETLENNRDIAEMDILDEIGYADYENKNDERPYLHLYSLANNKSFNHLSYSLIKGNFPKNQDELVISEDLYLIDSKKYQIGNKITLEIGTRTTLDGEILNENNPYQENEEQIVDKTTREFTIVGIMEHNYDLDSYGGAGISVVTTNFPIEDNASHHTTYIELKKPKDYEKSFSEILGIQFTKDSPISTDDYSLNSELLRWQAFKFSDSTVSMLYTVIAVVILIIVVTSIFCIKNSFDISVTEKSRIYGMLASIGATKKQIKKNVILEGLFLALIGIPLGILGGFLAVYVLVHIVNFLLKDFISDEVVIECTITLLPVVLSIVLGLITVYLSSIKAAKKASRVSPIESIKNLSDIKLTNRQLKVPKLIQKFFPVGGVIAYKNLKRSKKKYRTTVISLVISIFVFVSLNSFLYYTFKTTNTYYKDYDYNIMVTSSFEDNEKIPEVLEISGTEDYTLLYESNYTADGYLEITDLSHLTSFGKDLLKNQLCIYDEAKDEYTCQDETTSRISIVAMNEDAYRKYLKELNVKDTGKTAILLDNYVLEENDKRIEKRIYRYETGDTITGTYNQQTLSVPISKVTTTRPRGLENSYSDGGYLIVSEEDYHDLDFVPYLLTINAKDASQVVQDIKNDLPELQVTNFEQNARGERAVNQIVSIFLYGFITVIILIGVTNIFNTITSNLELRQREFATLKSIGMTKKEFDHMINLETIFYCTKALVLGTIFGLIGSYIIYLAYAKKLDFGYYLPIKAILLSAASIFLLVFIIMKYTMKKINRQNIIDTIRKENI